MRTSVAVEVCRYERTSNVAYATKIDNLALAAVRNETIQKCPLNQQKLVLSKSAVL